MYAALLIVFLACEVAFFALGTGWRIIARVRKHTEVIT